MYRYLLNVSYIGTQFRGVQKNFNKLDPYIDDPTTIQGVLEMGLQKLKTKNIIHVVPSSSSPNFDMDKVRETAELFCGLNDFRTFMGKETKLPKKVTRRTLELKISPGGPQILWEQGNFFLNRNQNFEYYNLIFRSEGFLYNQVRRIVGSLIAVGENKITPRDIHFMLKIPSCQSWNSRVVPAPSHGLYLWNVEY